MVENLKSKINEDFNKKNNTIQRFEEAYGRIINESENESQALIRVYLKEKKHLTRYIDETNEGDKKSKIATII